MSEYTLRDGHVIVAPDGSEQAWPPDKGYLAEAWVEWLNAPSDRARREIERRHQQEAILRRRSAGEKRGGPRVRPPVPESSGR